MPPPPVHPLNQTTIHVRSLSPRPSYSPPGLTPLPEQHFFLLPLCQVTKSIREFVDKRRECGSHDVLRPLRDMHPFSSTSSYSFDKPRSCKKDFPTEVLNIPYPISNPPLFSRSPLERLENTFPPSPSIEPSFYPIPPFFAPLAPPLPQLRLLLIPPAACLRLNSRSFFLSPPLPISQYEIFLLPTARGSLPLLGGGDCRFFRCKMTVSPFINNPHLFPRVLEGGWPSYPLLKSSGELLPPRTQEVTALPSLDIVSFLT